MTIAQFFRRRLFTSITVLALISICVVAYRPGTVQPATAASHGKTQTLTVTPAESTDSSQSVLGASTTVTADTDTSVSSDGTTVTTHSSTSVSSSDSSQTQSNPGTNPPTTTSPGPIHTKPCLNCPQYSTSSSDNNKVACPALCGPIVDDPPLPPGGCGVCEQPKTGPPVACPMVCRS